MNNIAINIHVTDAGMATLEGKSRAGADGRMLRHFVCAISSVEMHPDRLAMRAESSRGEANDAVCGTHAEQ